MLVWLLLISVATKGTHVPLSCVVNQTGEVRYDYKTSVVENGRSLVFEYLFMIRQVSFEFFFMQLYHSVIFVHTVASNC